MKVGNAPCAPPNAVTPDSACRTSGIRTRRSFTALLPFEIGATVTGGDSLVYIARVRMSAMKLGLARGCSSRPRRRICPWLRDSSLDCVAQGVQKSLALIYYPANRKVCVTMSDLHSPLSALTNYRYGQHRNIRTTQFSQFHLWLSRTGRKSCRQINLL